MYKIYNNEIKINQILKGGGVFGQSTSFDPHPLESDIYRNAQNGAGGNSLLFKQSVLKEEDKLKLVRPLYGTEIRYDNFNESMLFSILASLSNLRFTYTYYDSGYVNNLPQRGTPAVAADLNNLTDDEKKIRGYIKKNFFIIGIATLKQLGLFDHNDNDYVDFGKFKTETITKPKKYNADAGNFLNGLDERYFYERGFAGMAKEAFYHLLEVDNAAFTNTTNPLDANTQVKLLAEMNDIVTYTKAQLTTAFAQANFTNGVGTLLTIKNFYDKVKGMHDDYKDIINCKQIYYRQIFTAQAAQAAVNPRFAVGGNLENLNYMLNGGSLNTIIRIPNLTQYFKDQLKIVENGLRIKNKSLSVSSRNEILQIIEALEKHEKQLHDQFDLLKNAHLLDEDKISLRQDEDKLKRAKSSLRKYIRGSNGLYDIIENIIRITDDIKGKKKGFFEE